MAHGKPTRAKYKVVFQNGNYRCVCGRCVKAFSPEAKNPKWYLISNICNMDDDKTRCCGNCALCVHTYIGSECGLTDNPVDDNQAACIDYFSTLLYGYKS